MEKRILVTGGTGMVGTYLKEILSNAKYIGSKDCDLTDVDVVFHLAAYKKAPKDSIDSSDSIESTIFTNTSPSTLPNLPSFLDSIIK